MAAKLPPGTVVAGFRVESSLSHGAMAEVYRACDERGHIVALKLLDDTLARDERFRQRFLRESQLASSLDDPNIVRTIASGEDQGRLYLVMELIEGPDLRQLLRDEGRLEPERAVDLVERVAGALDAAHSAGLVHRDVKPGNILVAATEDGEHAYVCDFGLARHVSSVSSLTGDRGFVGTIDYVPPEQIEGGSADARADEYSLACVLYECLAGVRPFDRDSELSVVFAHLNEPPPKLTDQRPDLPQAFDDLFATALAKNPDDRYQTCGELAAAARAALAGEVRIPSKPRRRQRLAATLVATTLIVAAAVGTFLLAHSNDKPVTITPTSIAGAKLGDSSVLLTHMWGGGRKLVMTTPPNYSQLTQRTRSLSAYFVGTTDKTVEITTWDSRDRTAEGIGPCSTVAELKKVYGKRLRANPHATHKGIVTGWLVGKHLYFYTVPNDAPKIVNTVAIYSNDLASAGFNAANESACAPAVVTTAVKRPAHVPVVVEPALPATFISRSFKPQLRVRVPTSWTLKSDTATGFTLGSPDGATLQFRLDPSATSPDVSTTPNGLSRWLQKLHGLSVAAPQTILIGTPVLTSTTLDISAPRALTYLSAPGGDLGVEPGERTRVYLAPIRFDTLSHTLAMVLTAPNAHAFTASVPVVAAIVRHLRVAAAAGTNLFALSGFCTGPFQGTCKGEIDPGTYTTTSMRPQLTYTVPVGWTNSGDKLGFFGLIPPGGDFSAVDNGQSDYINVFTSIATGNGRCADGHGTIHTPDGFLRWFRQQPGFAPIAPKPVTISGLSGYVVDLTMRKYFTQPCPWSRGLPAQQVITGLPPSPDQMNHTIGPPAPRRMVMRLYLLQYKHGTLGIEIDDVRGDSRLATYSAVVNTFHFAPG